MEKFEKVIDILEREESQKQIIFKNGENPILLTSIHSMEQLKEDGTIKFSEPYTKAIVKYVSEKCNVYYMVKTKDNGSDPNKTDYDGFKNKMLNFINENKIKLVLDIHGAAIERPFDIELGTLNNLSADYSTINELKEAFTEMNISNVEINNPFKGGKLSQFVFFNTDCEVIQIEINKRYRNSKELDKCELVCQAIINFINQYINIIEK